MGFNLGKALGKLAGGVVSKLSGGLITPRINFNPPGRPAGVADSIISRTRGILPWQTSETKIFGPSIQPFSQGQGFPQQPGPGMGMVPQGLTPMAMELYCRTALGPRKSMKIPSPCPGYHWNTGRYYVFGDCRTGSQPGPVEAATRLVRNRRLNPANAQAARRAVRRLGATYSLLRSVERSLVKLGGRAARRASSAAKKRGCGCVGKCKC